MIRRQNVFDRAMAQLNDRLGTQAAVTIVYHRGDSSVVIEDATLGSTPFRTGDQGNNVLLWSEADFLIPAASLVLDGQRVEPEQHDWIEWTVEGTALAFRASAPEGEPTWTYSDPQRTRIRVHCKKVAFPG